MPAGRSVLSAALGVLLGLGLGFQPALLPAQEPDREPFDSLTVVLRGVTNVNRNLFHDFWDPGAGVELGAESPFYAGRVELGLQFQPFSARRPAQPDFLSWYAYVGWGIDARVPFGLVWYNGLRVGTYAMRFDTERVVSETRTEQELAAALTSRLRVPLGSGWAFDGSTRYRVVFTRRRVELLFVTLGVARSFGTPGWLQDFLR